MHEREIYEEKTKEIIYDMLDELYEENLIYIANSTEGDYLVAAIYNFLELKKILRSDKKCREKGRKQSN